MVTRPVDRFAPAVHDPGETVEIADPVSAATVRPWWTRDDLFWDTALFDTPIDWKYRYQLARIDTSNPATGRTRAHLVRMPDYEPIDGAIIEWINRSDVPLRILAHLYGWHHLSSEQIYCLGGTEQWVRQLERLFRLGIVQRGEYRASRAQRRSHYVYQLNLNEPPLRDLWRILTPEQKLAITGGTADRLQGGPPHDRHNLLAAELALRAIEVNDTYQAVFPEPFCSPTRMGIPGGGDWRADFGLVRSDGMRILVEIVQSSTYQSLQAKLLRWAKLLGGNHWNETGTIVVFVNANRTDHAGTSRLLRRLHVETLNETVLADHAGGQQTRTFTQRARGHIHLADWADWFPTWNTMSTQFADLATTTSADGGSTWVETRLADPTSWRWEPGNPARWQAPARTRERLYCTPGWIATLPMNTP